MRFGMVDHEGGATLVLATEAGLWPVGRACLEMDHPEAPETVMDLVVQGLLTRDFAEAVEESGVAPLSPTLRWRRPLRPAQVVAVGRNYVAHAKELGNKPPGEPILFSKSPAVVTGPGDAIPVREDLGRVDHEGELGVVIGRRAVNVSLKQARKCVAGYTLLNDVTARDLQAKAKEKGLPWFRAKNLHGFCPLGPAVVPADAFDWPPVLDLEVRVNGELRQQGSTGDMIFALPELIAYISRQLPLEPGDVIATGTPEGVGPLRPGDTVTVCCPPIGVLENPVVEA